MRHVRKFPPESPVRGNSKVWGRRWWPVAVVVALGNLWLASAAGAFPAGEFEEPLPVPSSASLKCESQLKPEQPSTCTATISGGEGSSFPRGVVTFASSGQGFFGNGGTCTLSRLTAERSRCQISYTPIDFGSHSIKAFYAGQVGTASTPGLEPSEAFTTIQVVVPVFRAQTDTQVECGPIGLPGESIACTVRVADRSANPSTPSGSVQFSKVENGSFNSGSCALNAESPKTATCVVNFVPAGFGSFQIAASYSGDGGHESSNGATAFEIVAPSTATAIGCQPASAPNAPTTCTATVVDTSASPNVPTGSVEFSSSEGGRLDPRSCTLEAVSANSAACSVPFTALLPGIFLIDARYGGDTGHAASEGATRLTVAGGLSQQSSSLLTSPRRTTLKAKRHKKAKAAKHRASRSR